MSEWGDIKFFNFSNEFTEKKNCEFAAYGADIVANRMTFV